MSYSVVVRYLVSLDKPLGPLANVDEKSLQPWQTVRPHLNVARVQIDIASKVCRLKGNKYHGLETTKRESHWWLSPSDASCSKPTVRSRIALYELHLN